MDACDCCFLGCLCGVCCAEAMDRDDRRRRDYNYNCGYNQPVYVQPVAVTTTAFVAPTNPNIYTTAPSGPYYYDSMGNTATTASYYPAYNQAPAVYAQTKY